MKSFNEYAQEKDIEAIKSILIEEGYDEPTQEQLVALLEAGFFDKVKKWGKGAALAGTLAATGLGAGSMMQKASNDAINSALQNSVSAAAAQQDDNAMQSQTVTSPKKSDTEVQSDSGGTHSRQDIRSGRSGGSRYGQIQRQLIQNKINRMRNRHNQMRDAGVSHGSFVGGKLVQ